MNSTLSFIPSSQFYLFTLPEPYFTIMLIVLMIGIELSRISLYLKLAIKIFLCLRFGRVEILIVKNLFEFGLILGAILLEKDWIREHVFRVFEYVEGKRKMMKFSQFKKKVNSSTKFRFNNECPICLCDMVKNEIYYEFKCGHTLHKNCVNGHFLHLSRCPICRVEL